MSVSVWNYYGIYPDGAILSPFWAIRGIISHQNEYSPRGVVTADKTIIFAPDSTTLRCNALYTHSYQWQKLEGVTWTDIAGETDRTIELTYYHATNGQYQYRCKLTGWVREGYTEPITIDVHPRMFVVGRSALGHGTLNKLTAPIVLGRTSIRNGVLGKPTAPLTLGSSKISYAVLSAPSEPIKLGETRLRHGVLLNETE